MLRCFFLFLFLILSSCSYNLISRESLVERKSAPVITAKECAWSPLWFPPIDKNYANIDHVARKNRIRYISSVNQVIYPFLLFSYYCLEVSGD